MRHGTYDCIDAGTENCPCYLALTGDCLLCSRLQGKDCCDCSWKGVCIYNEFRQSGERVNHPRMEFPAQIMSKKQYRDDLTVFIVKVGTGFALKASQAGSCVFLRAPEMPEFYNFPISVIKADPDRGEIHLAIRRWAAKTKCLWEETSNLIIKGVYRNGILGLQRLRKKRHSGKKTLILARGIGFAPAVLLADECLKGSSVDLFLDLNKIGRSLVETYLPIQENEQGKFGWKGGNVHFLSFEEEAVWTAIKNEAASGRTYDKIAVLTSDYYQESMRETEKTAASGIVFAYANNHRLCCGEGVCGACTVMGENGEVLRLCKCQM